ncbi:MAG: hypothetical protein U5Q16_00270 [Gammaproteobacteria bacterium]|nr:hypothetical protein [Gammaproteobacteria bacterium]
MAGESRSGDRSHPVGATFQSRPGGRSHNSAADQARLARLAAVDPDTLTPRAALELVYELRELDGGSAPES